MTRMRHSTSCFLRTSPFSSPDMLYPLMIFLPALLQHHSYITVYCHCYIIIPILIWGGAHNLGPYYILSQHFTPCSHILTYYHLITSAYHFCTCGERKMACSKKTPKAICSQQSVRSVAVAQLIIKLSSGRLTRLNFMINWHIQKVRWNLRSLFFSVIY